MAQVLHPSPGEISLLSMAYPVSCIGEKNNIYIYIYIYTYVVVRCPPLPVPGPNPEP